MSASSPNTGNLGFRDIDTCPEFSTLRQSKPPAGLKELLTSERIADCAILAGGGLTYNYAAKRVDDTVLDLLQRLAERQQLIEKYRALAGGAVMNTGEGRRVLHHLARGQLAGPVTADGRDARTFYTEQQERVAAFAEDVHAGRIHGSTGKKFDTVVQIGIGGSDLGPRALYLALEQFAAATPEGLKMRAHFISNVDPDDANAVLTGLDFERTLFIVVSKSGTTQETLTNRQFVLDAMQRAAVPGLHPGAHMIAVTSETSPLAKSDEYSMSFYIDDYIGGRYSSTSAVGGVVLSLAFGPGLFADLLAGAHEADAAALEPVIRKNAALMDAMIGIYERNVLGYPVTAILPYSQALSRFPAHLQQLDMESNGKQVNREGKPLDYATGPVIFGEPGTNGQHSFFQLLHQGTDVVPLQFIGFRNSQTRPDEPDEEGKTSRTKLAANLAAQIVAFALGKEAEDPNKNFPGGRPSSLIHGDTLTPAALGALLAHYENKVMFQGLAWNINSFDQEGVQLGKVLTKQILSGEKLDPVLQAYTRLLGVTD
jgi:glucose-6-phosphate isomerase